MAKNKSKKEEVIEEEVPGTQEATNEESTAQEEGSEKKEDSIEIELAEWKDKFLRQYSEFENYRKRTAKERLELIQTASQDLMSALLPVLDDFDRAISSMDKAEDVESVKQGVSLIHEKLTGILQQKGLKVMESPIGNEFDADIHEAITQAPAPSEDLKGKIMDEVEKGYQLHDKIIRYSKVVIGQ